MSHCAPIEELLRQAAPQALGALLHRFSDFADCEDAVQEALVAANSQWLAQGIPENPVGWLIHVASRRMADRLRSEQARQQREHVVAAQQMSATRDAEIGQDTLLLMFMCAHPALTAASAIALTLRAVAGLTTADIARAFLVPEATMAQRISRAKQNIKASAIPFARPEGEEWIERMRSVLHVLYLIFNEGYLTGTGNELARGDLSAEAIRLTRIVHLCLPEDPEVTGLLALMLLTEARRPARADGDGELIALADQDRALWDDEAISEGLSLIEEALSKGAAGEYQLQAAIAACHDRAVRAPDTDWRQILELYELLEQVTHNPMVTLNRAIAVAMVQGPTVGLTLLNTLEKPLGGHHRLYAVRAHLLEKAGDVDGAIANYRLAAAGTNSVPEQRYLLTQAACLSERARVHQGPRS